MQELEIQKVIKECLSAMNIPCEGIDVSDSPLSGCRKFVVKTPESRFLVGDGGEHLLALNHVVKRIVLQKCPPETEAPKFYIDINNFQEKLLEDLKTRATIMCERARSFKTNIELPPMSSYERMLVHSYLQNLPDIVTESAGVGRERRVVIKYKESLV